tara:strand:- start:73 stop:210 length:138 start_codon:yes stop_codon:yes gene_type:complete
MKPVYSKPKVIKEYKENGIKVTQYEMRKLKPVPMSRVYRKPGARK